MKKTIIFLLTVFLAFGISSAHDKNAPKKPTEDDFKKEAAILSEKLKITGDTMAKFEQIYVEYKTEIFKVIDEGKPKHKKGEKLTEKQIDELNLERFSDARKMLDIREKYYKRFLTVLKPSQVSKMYRMEKKLVERKRHEMNSRKAKRHACNQEKCSENYAQMAENYQKKAERYQRCAKEAQEKAERYRNAANEYHNSESKPI